MVKSYYCREKYLKGRRAEMNPPAIIDVTENSIEGEVKLQWEHAEGAHNYVVEYKGNSKDEKWKQADFVSGSFCIITGLKKNRKYKFRVAALNSTKRSRWSKTCELKHQKKYEHKIFKQ